MIYFTTFILALFFTHIARALPQACYDLTPARDMYYNDQYKPPVPSKPGPPPSPSPKPSPLYATHDKKYDDPQGQTKHVTCSGLAKRYPKFKDFPHYPFIGGAHDITPNSPNCGTCWKLTNKKTNSSIAVIIIDRAAKGYTLSERAYKKLGGGKGEVEVTAQKVAPTVCGGF